MSRQPEHFDYREMIRAAFTDAEWKPMKGYKPYLLLGGEDGPDAFRSWATGKTEPQASNLAILCYILNARLRELGKEAWLPNLPLPRRSDGGGGLESVVSDLDKASSLTVLDEARAA